MELKHISHLLQLFLCFGGDLLLLQSASDQAGGELINQETDVPGGVVHRGARCIFFFPRLLFSLPFSSIFPLNYFHPSSSSLFLCAESSESLLIRFSTQHPSLFFQCVSSFFFPDFFVRRLQMIWWPT